ncbi:hypothetical protein ACYATM_06685 [Lactobacillaceae bacterium Scapto_B20]
MKKHVNVPEYYLYISGDYEYGDLLNFDKKGNRFKISLSNFIIDNPSESKNSKTAAINSMLTEYKVQLSYQGDKEVITIPFNTFDAPFLTSGKQFPKIHLIDEDIDVYSSTLLGCNDEWGDMLKDTNDQYVHQNVLAHGERMMLSIYHNSKTNFLSLSSITIYSTESIKPSEFFYKDFPQALEHRDDDALPY